MTMRRVFLVLGLWLALAGLAQAAAVVWSVVTPQTCTGASAPAMCCLTGNAADNSTACNVSTTFGHFKVVMATFNPDGGTYSNTGAYSAHGNLLSTAQFRRLGLDSIVSTVCDVTATKGFEPILVGRRTLRIHLINPSTALELADLTPLTAGSTADVPGEQFDCMIVGY